MGFFVTIILIMKKKTKTKVYNIILLSFLSIIFLISTIVSSGDIITVLFGNKTEGMVIDSAYYGSVKGGMRITKISYTDIDNNYHIIENVNRLQPIHNQGDIINVYYSKSNPEKGVEFSLFNIINPILSLILLILVVIIIIKILKEKQYFTP